MPLKSDANRKKNNGRRELYLSDFDFFLPANLIAQKPLSRRDASRMMVVDRKLSKISHCLFRDILDFFDAGDVLVLNDTRVIPARLWGQTGSSRVEFLLCAERKNGHWEALARPARKVRLGDVVRFSETLEAEVAGTGADGLRILKFLSADVRPELEKIGYAPLPPYIKRQPQDESQRHEDIERYQTIYARQSGAIAAPTAGLHFTEEILAALRKKKVQVETVTLEVGRATFQPVRCDRITEHKMLEETYRISRQTASRLNKAFEAGRVITAVGTTVVRTLESAASRKKIKSGRGKTDLFIYPGYEFQIVGRLLTNFHLPRSTLLMLVSAFAGRELILKAYDEAVREGYRFFSYGDCMLII